MLLRRMIDHVKAQNWTAVALDFVIVVVGVFVGLQVSNWNAARQNRAMADHYLREIKSDLQADIDGFGDLIDATGRRVAAINYLLGDEPGVNSVFDMPVVLPRENHPQLPKMTGENSETLLAQANLARGIRGSRSGFEALLGSGQLPSVKNHALAQAIQRYYAGFDNLIEDQTAFRSIRNSALPIVFQQGFSIFGKSSAETVKARIAQDKAFEAYLRSSRELGEIYLLILTEQESAARALLTELNAELETR